MKRNNEKVINENMEHWENVECYLAAFSALWPALGGAERRLILLHGKCKCVVSKPKPFGRPSSI